MSKGLLVDAKYTFRLFFKYPGMTFLAIIALSLSIGIATTTFGVINGIFFKAPPYPESKELVKVGLEFPGENSDLKPVPLMLFKHLREESSAFESLFPYSMGTVNLSGEGIPERHSGGYIGSDFLEVLGVVPILGQIEDLQNEEKILHGVVISETIWESRYRKDPYILEKKIRINGDERNVLAVMPAGFDFPSNTTIWIPYRDVDSTGLPIEAQYVYIIGRKNNALNDAEIKKELQSALASYEGKLPGYVQDLSLAFKEYGKSGNSFADKRIYLLTIIVIVCILLISFANVANLLIGRSLTRGREMAIRSAMGASRSRIVQQLLTESIILASIGGIGGIIYAMWETDAIWSSMWNLPSWKNFQIDGTVILFSLILTLFAGLWAGLIPALQASKLELNQMLKESAKTTTNFRLSRFTRLLTILQVAFSFALIIGAGVMMRYVSTLEEFDCGFDGDQILTMRMGLFEDDYPDAAARDQFYTDLLRKVKLIPTVDSASLTSWLGNNGNYMFTYTLGDGRFVMKDEVEPQIKPVEKEINSDSELNKQNYAFSETVSVEHFKTFGIDIIEGRNFDVTNLEREIIINQALASELSMNGSVLGQVFRIESKIISDLGKILEYRVVGIVEDVRVTNLTKPDNNEPIIYFDARENPAQFMTLAVSSETAGTPELLEEIKAQAYNIDPHLPFYFVGTFQSFIDKKILPYRITARTFLSIGLMALFLAGIGVYGMVSFGVRQKRREIGIRMALGANSKEILKLVIRQGVFQVIIGIAFGILLAISICQLMDTIIIGSQTSYWSLFIGSFIIVCGISLLGFLIPTRRALKLSPLTALNLE